MISSYGTEQRFDPTAASPASARSWEWTEALATAKPAARYRVSRIGPSLARLSCRALGCAEGDVVTCLSNSGGALRLEREDGRRINLNRRLAWFVQAEMYSPGGPQPH